MTVAALWLLWVLWAIASAAFVTLLGRETWREVRVVTRSWLGPARWPKVRVSLRWRESRRREQLGKVAAPGLYRKAVR